MSRRAQAERERQAPIILGTAETEIASLFAKASEIYRENPTAMHLRAMNMLYEAIKEKGSMVIVPSSAVETMGLGGMLGTAALGAAPPVTRTGLSRSRSPSVRLPEGKDGLALGGRVPVAPQVEKRAQVLNPQTRRRRRTPPELAWIRWTSPTRRVWSPTWCRSTNAHSAAT